MKNRIILDTDIGGDIDDALALSLALNSPDEIDIVGITTVYLASEWRVGIIKHILETYNKTEIDVVKGSEKPLIGWWDENRDFDKSLCFTEVVNRYACDYIVEQINSHNNLVIVAIGPLTNIALALAKAPGIAKKTRVVMMGGCIGKAHPEWNIKCDPEAARIVSESGVPISLVGLDITNKCKLNNDHILMLKKAGNIRTALISEMIDKFLDDYKYLPILHDPLALATLIWPELFEFEKKTILIETKGEFTRGITVDCDWKPEPNVITAIAVKEDEFKKRLLSRLII